MIDVEGARPVLESVFAEHAALGRVPALAWGLVEGGALRAAHGAEAVYRIASMTKSFTCAAILLLRDEGRLALDDPIARHAPELAHLRGPTGDSPPLTIRHLVTMSGGFATDDPWADRHLDVTDAELDRWLAPGVGFAEAPGTAFEYSNLGFGLLGRVVLRITGAPVQRLVTEGLLRPLGMTRTTWTAPPDAIAGYRRRGDDLVVEPPVGDGAIAPMGGLFTTVADLARWVAFLADAFPPRDGSDAAPLSRASRREMQQVHRAFPPRTVTGRDGRVRQVAGGYGFGLNVTWMERIGWVADHSGGLPGFGSNMRWTRAGLGLVALGNVTYARMADATAAALAALLAAAGALRPGAPAVTEALRRAAEELVALHNAWDDRMAEALFADNVDLDEERDRRAAAAARLAAEHGPFALARVEASSATSGVAVAHGPRGELRIDFQLHPLLPPRVQHYRAEVTA